MTETKTVVDGWELKSWQRGEAKGFLARSYQRGDIFNMSTRPGDGEGLTSVWVKTQEAICPVLRVGQEEVTFEEEEAWVAKNFERMLRLQLKTVLPAGETLHAGVALGRKKTWRERVGWWMIHRLVPEAFVFSPVLKAWAQGRLG